MICVEKYSFEEIFGKIGMNRSDKLRILGLFKFFS